DNGKRWSPTDSDGRSHGTVRVIDALAHSYNQSTVRIGLNVGPQRVAELVRTLAGFDTGKNPSMILGAVDQSPYAMAQLYQFLASGGQIQPLHAVRGVLDANGKALSRYDTAPKPAQEGDAIAARLVTLALQQAVASGTGRQLMADGLGRLQPAGKTGTSNDGRDSWFAGWTGDHLAVIWVGNDQNKTTGLYGATGAMRVWSGLFSRMPSAPLRVGGKGIEAQWVNERNASTDAGCPGSRRFAFVAGFGPAYEPCPLAETDALDGEATDEEGGIAGFFGRLFGGDDNPAERQERERSQREQQQREELRRELEQRRLRDEQDRQQQDAEAGAAFRRRADEQNERIARVQEAQYRDQRARDDAANRQRREQEEQARRQREEEERRRREEEERRRDEERRRNGGMA
ncbi:MAG: hypothetical protein KA144_07290, partial [Xanthomonadaceae bacterium]|nr:hypothetical protein [Xanthomonadaceae bacterium]